LIYDAGSNITSLRLRDYYGDSNKHIDFTYDDLGRITAKNLPGSELDVTYGYDLLGRMTSETTSAQTLTLGYDALSRNTSAGGPLGTMSYQYDLADRPTRITWPDSVYVNYNYLVTGEVSTIVDSTSTTLATYAYDDLARRTSLTLGNGAVTSYGYDNVSRLTSLALNLSGSTYDVTSTLGYSPAGQIATRTQNNDNYAWTGHYNVNRGYTSNGLSQLTAAGGTSLGHDARGNLTSSGSDSFSYSSENLLTSATVASATTTLAHDPQLRLYELAAPGSTLRFQYDGGHIVTEYNTSGVVQRRYIHGPGADEPLARYEGSGTSTRSYMSADERGSIVANTDNSGALISGAIGKYDEYGIPGSSPYGRFQYTGQAYLPSVGLYYYKARLYSPTLGRFLQTDPIGYGDGLNIYAYVHDDPVNATDPSGLCGPGNRAPTEEEIKKCTADEAEHWRGYQPLEYLQNSRQQATWGLGRIDAAMAFFSYWDKPDHSDEIDPKTHRRGLNPTEQWAQDWVNAQKAEQRKGGREYNSGGGDPLGASVTKGPSNDEYDHRLPLPDNAPENFKNKNTFLPSATSAPPPAANIGGLVIVSISGASGSSGASFVQGGSSFFSAIWGRGRSHRR
jgi:RHS repeat-associated protein